MARYKHIDTSPRFIAIDLQKAAETIPRSYWAGRIIASNARRCAHIRSSFVRWRLNGFEFSIGAGKTIHLMTRPLI